MTGLAVATVSRALADAPDLRADTKALVRKVADELGYVPNRAGLRLRTGRTQVIALAMSPEHDMMNNTARLISSLAGTLRETPYHLNVSYFFPGEDLLKPIRHIVETGLADAVIFNQTLPDDPRVAWLMERRFPFATHGRTRWADRHAWADFDNLAFGAIAVRRLARAGRRRIAVIAPPLDQNYAQDIVAGATLAAAEAGVEVRILPQLTSDAASAVVQERMAQVLPEGVDGVICASTNSAMATVAALESLGLRLGREIDLVAKEAIPFLSLFRREIIAIREDVGRAGAVLARAAMRAIREPGAPPLQDLETPQDDDQ
ncbi:LacI family transcriptional regulator [Rubellimicrobium roseum]|uniref:LacI family transcriptional regulator n=2 Tax=Rubellimicrobium roseum TaxID=687525 RepID=A0A5C4NPP4_9RHOB|nr:LacI family transcriptional regulator [Rubellimicrobium roseum]